MKKVAILILSILSLAFTSAFFGAHYVASANESVETEAFMPASALELYALTSPISVSYKDGFMVISEYYYNQDDESEFNRISVYNPNNKKFFALPDHETISNVTYAEYHNGYVYYLSGSSLYYVPINDLSAAPVKTSVTSANFFSFNENTLITNSSNTINLYEVNSSDLGPTFTNKPALTFTTKLALLSSEKFLYYTQAGKLYCNKTTTNKTTHLVGDLNVDVNYMVECGNYIYYTATTGVYRIAKGENSTPEIVVASNPQATELGSFSNPQGISVRNGNLLIADSNLKCIQEIEGLTGRFTNFAITTESTADYRLTSNASKIMASENFVYVLDDLKALDDGTVYKRLVKIASGDNGNSYTAISLEPLYAANSNFKVEQIAVSNTHALIYDGINLNLYTLDGLEVVYSTQNETVTTLNYLDGDFYYTDKALNDSLSAEIINVHKISLPSEDNELTSISEHNLTAGSEITGSLIHSTVDVFGNIYLLLSDGTQTTKLIRYYNGNTSIPCEISHNVTSLKTDFSGNVYALTSDGIVYKYTYKSSTRTFDVISFALQTGNLSIKDFELNYRSNKCYLLSDACVLVTTDDALQISNLSGVPANDLKLTDVNQNPTFLTVNKDAKLFKVTIGNYAQVAGVDYFKDITPISNPNTSRVYLVIAEIQDDYYLVSFSQKLIALVRKTTVNTDPTFKSDATIISPDNYPEFNVTITEHSNENYYISNDTAIYAKPIYDDNYKRGVITKNSVCKALKTFEFNGFKTTLIANEENEVIGYVPSGYLIETILPETTTSTETVTVLGGDNGKLFNDSLMILIIALTITLTLLFIEKKLLFTNEN